MDRIGGSHAKRISARELDFAIQADEAELTAACAEVAARPIAYPIGGNTEELALLAGLKPMIRQIVQPSAAASTRDRFERAGLSTLETGAPPQLRDLVTIYAGRDPARLREAAAAEQRVDPKTVGALLGYPACCVEGFSEIENSMRSNPQVFNVASRRTHGTPRARLNVLDLGIYHFIPWLPCSFSCAASLQFADAVATLALERPNSAGFFAQIESELARSRLLVLNDVQLSIAGSFAAGEIAIEQVWATATARHPRSSLSPDAIATVARLLIAVRRGRRLRVEGSELFVDDALVVRSEDLLLVPFAP